MNLLTTFAALLVLASPAFQTQAQTPPPSPSPEITTLTSRSTLVLVPTLVSTKKGEPVFTLEAKDFTLTDDGIEQKVFLEEDTGEQPLALVVAIQTGGAGARKLDDYRTLPTLIEALVGNVKHRVAVVTFDGSPAVVQPFTADLDLVARAIGNLDDGDNGAAILDTLGFSVDLLRKQPLEYRRAILLLSETIDHGSQLPLERALRAVSDTNTAIYSLAFSSSRSDLKHESAKIFSGPPGPPHGCMGQDPDADPDPNLNAAKLKQAYDCLSLLAPPLRLAKIAAMLAKDGLHHNIPETVAHLTGGEYFKFEDTRALERALITLTNHLPNRYYLTFQPQSPHPGLHALTLQLKDYDNLRITARSSYWADPDPATPNP